MGNLTFFGGKAERETEIGFYSSIIKYKRNETNRIGVLVGGLWVWENGILY